MCSFSFPNLYIPLKKYVFILILLNQIIVLIWQFCSLLRLRQQTTKQRWHDAYLEWFCPWVAWDVVCFFHWSMSRVPCPMSNVHLDGIPAHSSLGRKTEDFARHWADGTPALRRRKKGRKAHLQIIKQQTRRKCFLNLHKYSLWERGMANSLGLSAMLGNWAWTLASSGESWRVLRLLDKQGAGNHWHSEAG